MRTFDTGATRNSDNNKLEYDGFLSNDVLRGFAKYMHGHRMQSDGTLRESNNRKKGIPMDVYMKSAFRHFMDWWSLHESEDNTIIDSDGKEVDMNHILGAMLFNVQGYWHEYIKKNNIEKH